MSDRLDIKLTTNVKNATTSLKQFNNELGKTSSSLSAAFNVGKLYAFWNVTKKIRTTMLGWVKSSIDFIETTNKFEVSMGRMSEQATKFQNKLSEAFGTARTEMMDFQANFNNILGALPGLAEETSYALSETLTQMGLDYASLFNVSTESAMQKIQAALVGNVKSIRSTSGYDITDATIADLAQQLGVEKSVRQMSQMEKRLLRIIALSNQMKSTGAMSDFARTIDQPANQLRVLRNQLQELGLWLGNVFIGTISKILPYINGFVMALKEIVKTLAIFVGYKAEKNIADPIQTASTYSGGLANNMGSAAKSAKELKKTLMGFDVLNVIQTPSTSGGGGGGGGSVGSIDPAILNALSEYDSMMDQVSMKATKVRDKIMDWLGFQKDINEETGETTWKLKDGYTNIEKIRDAIKIIGTILIVIAGLKLLDTIAKIGLMLTTFSGFASAFPSLAAVISKISASIAAIGFDKLILIMTKTIAVIGGLVIAIRGLIGYIQEIKNKVIDVNSAMQKVISIVVGVGVAFAAVFGIIPGLIASLVAAVGVLIYTLITRWDDFVRGIKYLWNKLIEAWTHLGDVILDKWRALGDALVNGWNTTIDWIKNKLKEAYDWIAQWFTKEKWKKIFAGMKDGFVDVWNSIKSWFSNLKLNIKMPHFTWTTTPATGWVKKVLEALNIPASLPKLDVKWYANGGFPANGEMFMARESGPELVGKMGNTTAVVNNQQIVESVSRGVAEAVSGVMGNNNGNYNFYLDGKQLTDVVIERLQRNANISGVGVH